MSTDNLLLVFFEDESDTKLSALQIRDLSNDLASWLRFLRMLAGGPPALMTMHMPDGTRQHCKVARPGTVRPGSSFRRL